MNARQHALIARALIDACGGVDEATSALERLPSKRGRTQLYKYRDAGSACFMPADVIADLEAYCGKPIYSQILFEARPSRPDASCLIKEACDVGESGVTLQALVRRLAGDDDISENDAREIEAFLLKHDDQVRQVRGALQRVRP